MIKNDSLECAIKNSGQYVSLFRVLEVINEATFKTPIAESLLVILERYERHRDLQVLAADLFQLDGIDIVASKDGIKFVGNATQEIFK